MVDAKGLYERKQPALNHRDPIQQLFALGRPESHVDYQSMGFEQTHIPALLALLDKPSFFDEEYESDDEATGWYATIHAWHVLGQLQAAEAVPALIEQIRLCDREDIDWGLNNIPRALGGIGPVAMSALDAALVDGAGEDDDEDNEWVLVALCDSLKEIGAAHPEARDAVVALLQRELNLHRELYSLNGLIIGYLASLKAVEAIDAIHSAFQADLVDRSGCGDLENVEIELGLRSERDTPPPPSLVETLVAAASERAMARRPRFSGGAMIDDDQQKRAKKAKRKKQKLAKKQRKKNRR